MVDIAGGDGNADHSDHVLKVQHQARQKPFRVRRRNGEPNPETRLGEQQLRRQSRTTESASLSSPGFSRWKNT